MASFTCRHSQHDDRHRVGSLIDKLGAVRDFLVVPSAFEGRLPTERQLAELQELLRALRARGRRSTIPIRERT